MSAFFGLFLSAEMNKSPMFFCLMGQFLWSVEKLIPVRVMLACFLTTDIPTMPQADE